jgi:hypothetical protein
VKDPVTKVLLILSCSLAVLAMGWSVALQSRVQTISGTLSQIERKNADEFLEQIVGEEAKLDLSKPGYARVDASAGELLIAIDSSRPTEEGYLIDFTIGNPGLVTYNEFEIRVSWGREAPKPNTSVENYSKRMDEYRVREADWQSKLRRRTIDFKEPLPPGRWTRVPITFPETTADQLRHIGCRIGTSSISLSEK